MSAEAKINKGSGRHQFLCSESLDEVQKKGDRYVAFETGWVL